MIQIAEKQMWDIIRFEVERQLFDVDFGEPSIDSFEEPTDTARRRSTAAVKNIQAELLKHGFKLIKNA